MSCTSVLFGLFKSDCISENRVIGISDQLVENVTSIMTNSTNEVVQHLEVFQSIRVNIGPNAIISCDEFNLKNNFNSNITVNQEIDEKGRTELINAISQSAGWDAQLQNTERTGFFSTPGGSQLNTTEIANYFKSLTENTLTVERLNQIAQSLYLDQEIVLNIDGVLTSSLCNFSNDAVISFFVAQSLYAVLEAFQSNSTQQDINVAIKQEMSRENNGIFESLFGSLGNLLKPIIIIGGIVVAVILVIIVVQKLRNNNPSKSNSDGVVVNISNGGKTIPNNIIQDRVYIPTELPTSIETQIPVISDTILQDSSTIIPEIL